MPRRQPRIIRADNRIRLSEPGSVFFSNPDPQIPFQRRLYLIQGAVAVACIGITVLVEWMLPNVSSITIQSLLSTFSLWAVFIPWPWLFWHILRGFLLILAGKYSRMMLGKRNVTLLLFGGLLEEVFFRFAWFLGAVSLLHCADLITFGLLADVITTIMELFPKGIFRFLGISYLLQHWDVFAAAIGLSWYFSVGHRWIDRSHARETNAQKVGYAATIGSFVFSMYMAEMVISGGIGVAILFHVIIANAWVALHSYLARERYMRSK